MGELSVSLEQEARPMLAFDNTRFLATSRAQLPYSILLLIEQNPDIDPFETTFGHEN
jgi:hypothetical protein